VNGNLCCILKVAIQEKAADRQPSIPCRYSQVALESAWRMYFSVNIIVSLFRDLHASDKQVRLVSRRSMGSTTRLLMSRDLAKM
jgi:hypothetical protein